MVSEEDDSSPAVKLLCIDTESLGVDLLMRAQLAGHDVMHWDRPNKDGTFRKVGKGLIPQIRDYDALRKKWIGWADLIWCTQNNAYLELLEPYRQMGYPLYGGNVEAAKWESDRAEGQRIMKECGLKVIPGKEFHDYDAAIAYVKKHPNMLVSKPSGDVSDKALSHVGDSAADLIYMLQEWKKNPKFVAGARENGFILQEKKTGCEMGVGGWYGPGGWLTPIEENFEFKKKLTGDLGQNTGEQGTLMRFVKKSKLADLCLFPMTKKLKEIGYCGNVDVNCIIDDAGVPWPLEFTMREGWPAKHNQVCLTNGDPVQWMLDFVNGEDTIDMRHNEVSISVVMSTPKPNIGVPLYGATDLQHVHLCEAMLCDSVPTMHGDKVVNFPCYGMAGDYICVLTGCGDTITGARRSAYAAIDKIKSPKSLEYRTDIGRGKLVDNLAKIQRHGFATGLTY